MEIQKDHTLWMEKYRPQTVNECILPDNIKASFTAIVDSKELPHLMLSGTSGVGKTTVARALCKELDVSYIIINCSNETGIDTLRHKITNFASSASLMGSSHKAVILDEFDYSSTQFQAGLRNFMEEFSKVCSFIITCNHSNRIIEAIHSRCVSVKFEVQKEDRGKMAMEFLARVEEILKYEKVPYEKKVVASLIMKYFPDNRKILNELQRYSKTSGGIDIGVLGDHKDAEITSLVDALEQKNFSKVRQWVADNADTDTSGLYRKLYDILYERLEPSSVPPMILEVAEWQKTHSQVPDLQVHIAGLMVSLMASVVFK